MKHTKEIVETLKKERESAEKSFEEVFKVAAQLAQDVFRKKLEVPRLTSKQTTRQNYQTDSPEAYYRIAVFIPCVDSLIQNLSDKFLSNEDILPSFQMLLPGFATSDKVNDLENLSLYFDDRVSLSAVKAEYKLWCKRVSSIDKETEVLKVLELCDATYFPTIKYLLTVLATLPVTTASVMGDERLSALAMLAIHWDCSVDPDEVLDIMGAKKSRRLNV